MALTGKKKKLAAMYGDKNKITRGDIITAAKRKADKAKGLSLIHISEPTRRS